MMLRDLPALGRVSALLLAAGLATTLLAGPALATAQPPGLSDFRTGDGAYFTTVGGDLVDPYFVNKAFIVLLQARVDVRAELDGWLAWLLPRQRADGGSIAIAVRATAIGRRAARPMRTIPRRPPPSSCCTWRCATACFPTA
ncbi:hypothetical protein ACFSTJ_14205 [Ottowia pentelensis]|uniref:hypothetical protein n=1 Tax=Ottowia pentelensis TaxID=511108 RepID=UPI00363FB367